MIYEAEIRFRRGDPERLAADLKAVEQLLNERSLIASEGEATPPVRNARQAVGRRNLELVRG